MSEPNDSSLSHPNNDSPPVLRRPTWLSPTESPQTIHKAVSKLINFMSQPQDDHDCDSTEVDTKLDRT
jgi:hypothetical protein